MLLLGWHCFVSQVFLTIATMLKTEPMRCQLWLCETPAGIPAAAMALTTVVLDAGCRVMCSGLWKANFVTHDEIHSSYSKRCMSTVNKIGTKLSRVNEGGGIFCKRRWQRARSSRMVSETIESLITNAF
ncbi:hypothetical protein [Mesorhizobium caraganae]|uniref:hypothetical protein n=1 Tax=Mesorhizobium caraganae TaxID=483206 RepID=UPI0017847A82|nr:hypothetical protein [Mesorhizobium caraganae]